MTTTYPGLEENPIPRWNLLDALLIGAVSIVIIFIGFFVIGSVTEFIQWQPEAKDTTPYPLVIAIIALEGFGILAGIYLLGIARKKISLKDLGAVKPSLSWLKKAALAAILMIPVMGFIAAIIQMLLGLPPNNPQLEFIVPADFSYITAVVMLVVAGFFVPLAEELYFRGVLYSALRNHFGIGIGAIVSSLIFGALHGDISIAGATFVMGLVLAYFYEKSRSIWPSVLIHALNNSLKLAAIYILLAFGGDIPGL